MFALRAAVYFLCIFCNSSKWGGKSSISIHENMFCVLLSASFYYISIKDEKKRIKKNNNSVLSGVSSLLNVYVRAVLGVTTHLLQVETPWYFFCVIRWSLCQIVES